MGALEIDKGTIKRIYACGAQLGLTGAGRGREDELHALVLGLTGKESVRALTPAEGLLVEQELKRRMAAASPAASKRGRKRKYTEAPGGLSAKQQKMIWYLMFQLEKYDPSPEGVQRRDRLCGLIEKQCRITASPADPFRWLRAEQGGDLIEALKSMATRAEEKYLHSPEYRQRQEAARHAK